MEQSIDTDFDMFGEPYVTIHQQMTKSFGHKNWMVDQSHADSDQDLLLYFSAEKFAHDFMHMRQGTAFPFELGWRFFLSCFVNENIGFIVVKNFDAKEFCKLYSRRGRYVTPFELVSCVNRSCKEMLVDELYERFLDVLSTHSRQSTFPLFCTSGPPPRGAILGHSEPCLWYPPTKDEKEEEYWRLLKMHIHSNKPYPHLQNHCKMVVYDLKSLHAKHNPSFQTPDEGPFHSASTDA